VASGIGIFRLRGSGVDAYKRVFYFESLENFEKFKEAAAKK
jgi:hypothetical protein